MSAFHTDFNTGERVIVDGDTSLVGIVTAILVRGKDFGGERYTFIFQYEVSWFHNGESKTSWIEEYRLSRPEK